jgi:hypothetical protein
MTRPGFGRCSDCRKRVLFALAVSGDVIAFDAAFEDGPWAVAWDCTRTPRCRPRGKSGDIREGEYLYRQHAAACPASAGPVAMVTPIDRGRPRRRLSRTATPRRAANAR